MDTLFFIVITGREVLLASSGEKLGVAAKHPTAHRTAPQERVSSPKHRQLRLRNPPCWSARVLTCRALPPLPFLLLGFQDTMPVMSPPASLLLSFCHLCGPTSVPQLLNTGVCQAQSLDFILPPSLTPVHTLKYLHPYPYPSPEFKSWSRPPAPTEVQVHRC